MTVREYIGARYVPLFMGNWDNTSTYEPLSIVSYQGNSYTSRQAVPVGIDIANTTYWAQTGNYNAQIEQYRAEVQAFDDRIDKLAENTGVSDIETRETTLVQDIEANDSRIDKLAENTGVSDIETRETTLVQDIETNDSRIDKLAENTGVSDIETRETTLVQNIEMLETNTGVSADIERATSLVEDIAALDEKIKNPDANIYIEEMKLEYVKKNTDLSITSIQGGCAFELNGVLYFASPQKVNDTTGYVVIFDLDNKTEVSRTTIPNGYHYGCLCFSNITTPKLFMGTYQTDNKIIEISLSDINNPTVTQTLSGSTIGRSKAVQIMEYKDDKLAWFCDDGTNEFVITDENYQVIETITVNPNVNGRNFGLFQGCCNYSKFYDAFIFLYSGFSQFILVNENSELVESYTFNHRSYGFYELGEVESISEVNGTFYVCNNQVYMPYIGGYNTSYFYSLYNVWSFDKRKRYSNTRFAGDRQLKVTFDSTANEYPIVEGNEITLKYGIQGTIISDIAVNNERINVYVNNFTHDVLYLNNIAAIVYSGGKTDIGYMFYNCNIQMEGTFDYSDLSYVMGSASNQIIIMGIFFSHVMFANALNTAKPANLRCMASCNYGENTISLPTAQSVNPTTLFYGYANLIKYGVWNYT